MFHNPLFLLRSNHWKETQTKKCDRKTPEYRLLVVMLDAKQPVTVCHLQLLVAGESGRRQKDETLEHRRTSDHLL